MNEFLMKTRSWIFEYAGTQPSAVHLVSAKATTQLDDTIKYEGEFLTSPGLQHYHSVMTGNTLIVTPVLYS